MTTQILEKLFGSSARVKLMRLFLFNSEKSYDKEDVVRKSKISPEMAGKELSLLENIGLIKKSTFKKEIQFSSGLKVRRVRGFILNQKFIYLNHLKNLLVNTVPLERNDLAKNLAKVCNPKLILVSGVFLQVDESRIDLLVVADNVREAGLKALIAQIESEIGKEIRYTLFSSADFKYRMGLNDHLIRDIFDLPHKILVDKIGA